MKVYFLPGSCSLATKISLTEAGQNFEAIAVDRATKKAADGKDYFTINPKGYVPALVLDDGTVLTENVAVLSYVGSLDSTHTLAPPAGQLRPLPPARVAGLHQLRSAQEPLADISS